MPRAAPAPLSIATHRRVRRGGHPARGTPAPLALALAIAFCAVPLGSPAQTLPTGGVAIHGQAQVTQPGANQMLVTTQNGPGTNHSAINWQSFSIGQGASTHFAQPNAASLSINRVVTNTPSALFGSLSSNGHLVLVNQSGIAIGAGAMVDTAGFTASTLRMSDADAIAGRLRFGDAGVLGSATLTVDGQVLARHGDVVLIAPQLEAGASALLQSPNGATVLAAGQQVEITGRGLEGIRLVVQAPDNEARNLGTLTGDAVGIFAGTLRHSGQITATTAALEGGTVVLKAAGDAYVQGNARIDATGTGGQGGQVDVLGQRVAVMDHASIDASGAQGGGTLRIGGDYQGKNVDVPNATRSYVGPQTVLRADAVQQGDGGRIIVWADEQTQAYGRASARGGAQGGDGGFVEMSGKHRLHFDAAVDTRAPLGKTGTLLLDPDYIDVSATGSAYPGAGVAFADFGNSSITLSASSISASTSNVVLQANEDININAAISMAVPGVGFTAQAGGYLNVQAPIVTRGGNVDLSAGDPGSLTSPSEGSLNINATIDTTGGGTVPGGGEVILRSYISDVGGNSIYIAAPINAGTAQITLSAPNGRVEQNSAGSLRGGDLTVLADYEINLAQAGNEIGGGVTLVTNTSTSGTGTVAFSNLGAFTVDGASAKNDVTLSGNGAIATAGSITSVLGNVSLSADFDILLGGNVTAGGAFTASSETGRIMQQSGTISVAGATSLAASGRIQLLSGQTTNAFAGPLAVSGNDAVVIAANSALSFTSLGVGATGELILYADGGALTLPAGAINVGSGMLLLSSAGAFSTPGALTATGSMYLHADGALTIGHDLTAGTLQLSSNANLTQTAGRISATGLTQATSGGGSVTLTSATNDFSNLYLVGTAVAVRDLNALELAGANVSSLNVQANGNLTQSAAVVVSGTTTLAAGTGNVTLTTAGNNLNILNVSGNAIQVVEGAGSALTVTGLSSGLNQAVSLTAGHNLTLQVPINTGTGALTLSGLTITLAPAATLAGGDISLFATNAITLDAAVTAGGIFTATTTSGTGSLIVHNIVQSAGAMNLDLGGALTVDATGGATAALRSSGGQTIDAQSVIVQAGTGASAAIENNSGNAQTITSDTLVNVFGGSGGSNNFARITSIGNQTLTANTFSLAGGAGTIGNYAAIKQNGTGAFSQTVNVRTSGSITLAGGSSTANGLADGIDGSFASIQAHGATGQTVNFLSGGLLVIGGGNTGGGNYAELWTENGPQTITGNAFILLTGGSSGGGDLDNNGNGAFLGADVGAQTISAQRMQLHGGSGGIGNAALVLGKTLQNITIGSGGLEITGGGGTGSDTTNMAGILQLGTGAGTGQTITLQGGSLAMAGGSSAATNVGLYTGDEPLPNFGAGSSALIRSDGVAQAIAFTSAGGSITMTGGSVGSRNEAGIESYGDTQTIGGTNAANAPTLQMTAGSGGATGEGNHARIAHYASGLQKLDVADTTLNGGSGTGTDGAALIVASVQDITVRGNLALDGGSGSTTNGGARIGGRVTGNTDLALTVTGNLSITGGANGAGLGSSPSGVAQTNDISVTAGGDISLTPGGVGVGGVRIGSRNGDVQAGDIALAAGGSIFLNAGGGAAAAIRTLGSVVLSASSGSILQDPSAVIIADSLSAGAHSGIALAGSNNDINHVYLGNASSGQVSYTGAAGKATVFTGVDQSGGGDVVLYVDDIGITGPINNAGGQVIIAPATLSRSMVIEASPTTAGVLSLSPAEMQAVNAAGLRIGRFNATGSLTLDTTVGSLNVGNLYLWNGGDIIGTAGSGLGSSGLALNSNVELLSNLNVSLLGAGIYLADNRDLGIKADQDGNNTGSASITDSQLRVGTGTGNTSGDMVVSGHVVQFVASGGVNSLVRVEGTGTQNLSATQVLSFVNSNTGTGELEVIAAGGVQSLTSGGQVALSGGTGTGTSTLVTGGSAQSVNALGLYVTAGSSGGGFDTGNKTALQSLGSQTLSIGASGIVVSGGGGSLTDNFAVILQVGAADQQTITLSGGGGITVVGGTSSGAGAGAGHGSFASIQSLGAAQNIVLDGGSIAVSGGSNGTRNIASIAATGGNQSITGASSVLLTGGINGGAAGTGNIAAITTVGTQVLSASTITLQGGAGGLENSAYIVSDGNQSITAMGMSLAGGDDGGGSDVGNRAIVQSGAGQSIALGAGGLTIEAGGGSLTDNAAMVLQNGTGAAQTITIGTGGNIVMAGGSSAQSNVGGATHGSRALIESKGTSQTISMAGGNVTLTGGSAGSRAYAQIYAENGTQTITGAGNVQLTGGTGGVPGEGNFASIHAAAGPQTLNAANILLQGGGAGADNFAAVMANTQTITASGNVVLHGALAPSTGSGARIGGRGEGSTNLTLNAGGAVTLQAGVGSGASIGSNITAAPSGQTSNVAVTAVGDITLTPLGNFGVVIGSVSPNFLPGAVSVTSTTGDILLQASGGTGLSGVASLGNVTLVATAGDITEASTGGVLANQLVATAGGAITLTGTNAVSAFTANSGGDVRLTNTRALTLGSITTASGQQTVEILNTAQMTVAAASVTDDAWDLSAAGDLLLTAPLTAGSASLISTAGNIVLGANLSIATQLSLGTDGGSITQTSGGITAGNLLFHSGSPAGDVTLASNANDFGTASGVGGTVRIRDANTLTLDTFDTTALVVQTVGDLLVLGSLQASNTGDAVALATTTGQLIADPDASIATPNGRWLLYAATPGAIDIGNLTANFKQYGATDTSPILGTGNGLMIGAAATITASITGGLATKVYDGNNGITLDSQATFVTYTGGYAEDGIVLQYNPAAVTLDNKNVGSNKAVSTQVLIAGGTTHVGGLQVYGYTFLDTGTTTSTAVGNVGEVTPATVTVSGATAASKVYDGTRNATVNMAGATLAGMVAGDDLLLAGGVSGLFDTRNVGTGKLVTFNGLALAGADAGNYVFATGPVTATADITPASISVVGGITALDKFYDATTLATLISSGAVLNGVVSGDVLTLDSVTGAFADKNAGNAKTVVITGITLGGADAGNYVLGSTQATTTANIAKAPLTLNVSGVSAQNKVYDGTRVATLNTSGATLSGVFSGDDVALGAITGLFADKNVGTAKSISFDQFGVTGADIGNYDLGITTATPLSADITPRMVSAAMGAAGTTKVYDGNLLANVSASGAVIVGMVAGDDLGITIGSAQYDSRHVGARTVSAAITGLSGADAAAGNYVLASGATLTAEGTITQRALSTWLASTGGDWSLASNWDALPDGNNVAAVRIPAGAGSVRMDVADVRINSLQSLRPLVQDASGGSFLTSALLLELQGGASLLGNNRIGALSATNSGSGDIVLANTGTLLLGVMDNSAGSITIANTGAVVTSALVNASVDVHMAAMSPLTVGSGGITAGNDIVLSAGTESAPGPSDNLTLNGPLTAGNTVSLFAGNDLVQNANILGNNGVTAQALGSYRFDRTTTTTGRLPVRYTLNGQPVEPPPETLEAAPAEVRAKEQVAAASDAAQAQTQDALDKLTGKSTATNVEEERKKDKEAIVAEGEICK